jgi:nucleoside-diphosphate-sugar epimerase
MNIGITGASGVLGSILLKKLDEKGYEYSSFEGNIRKTSDIKKWADSSFPFDVVIHLAAIVPTAQVRENLGEAFEVNSVGTKNLVDVLNDKASKAWVFYSSTSHVYKSKDNPLSEDDEIEPVSEYGLTKYAGEILAKRNYEKLCIGRIFSMYHDTQKPPFLYPNIKRRLEKEDLEESFELYGAESIRDFLNAEDIAEMILELMEKQPCGVYNIASGKGTKIRDFVQSMSKKKLKIKALGNKDVLVANVDKLRRLLNE